MSRNDWSKLLNATCRKIEKQWLKSLPYEMALWKAHCGNDQPLRDLYDVLPKAERIRLGNLPEKDFTTLILRSNQTKGDDIPDSP